MHINNLGQKFHNQPKAKIERGCEGEKEGSSVPIFLPPKFRICENHC